MAGKSTQSPAPAPTADAPVKVQGAPNLQPAGNDAAQAQLKGKVQGPIGRVWNHVLGKPEGSTDTDALVADRAMVRSYLDKRLGLAEGEWFRDKKLDGVADKLIESLDADKDQKISWNEFRSYEDQIFALLAPGVKAGAADADTEAAAATEFGRQDRKKDGKLSKDDLQANTREKLPEGTDHADLIAQLGARVAIDAVDRDEGSKPIGQRSLSREEWTGAAREISAGRR
jgi:hypothetical protein